MIVRAVLWLCAPECDVETIAGDLYEEFNKHQRGRWWRTMQAIRSAGPLLSMRWRSGELPVAILTAMLAVAIPLRIADVFWALIHSLVPLKADTSWATPVWLSNLAIACIGALVGARIVGRHTARVFALLSIGGVAFSMFAVVGRAPLWYVAALSILIPAAALIAGETRRLGGKA